MGIFDFVKKAGAKLFGKGGPEDNAETYKPLRKHVEENGISARDIKFRVTPGAIVVEGYVPDQDTREKVIMIVGNVEGVDKVDDRLRVGNAPPDWTASSGELKPLTGGSGSGGSVGDWTSTTYTVKSGDTLSGIAKAQYGDAKLYPRIFEANKPMLKDPDKIYPGQVLRIPK